MSFLSPWFWLAILIYGGVCASGGAVVMEKIDNGTIQTIRAEAAEHELDAAKRAKVITEKYTAEGQRLAKDLLRARTERDAATRTLKEKQRAFSSSVGGRASVPADFVWLWNAPGADTGNKGVGADVRPAGSELDGGPSGVALGDVPVAEAKDALGACRDQVKGLQAHLNKLWAQIDEWMKGLAP